jgi:hypothetical protein
MNLLSKIDAIIYSKKTSGTTPTQVSFFDSTSGTNLPTPNTIPANWKRFTIMTIKLFVNKFINMSNVWPLFLSNSYFEFKISNYLILSSNLSNLFSYRYAFILTPSSASNVFEIPDIYAETSRGYLKLEKPIILEPSMTFTFTIYLDTFSEFNNVDMYLIFRGILEKEIVG